ncbi:hypothetical protein SBA6_620004 [Candidatus Sulfopaludibacter sp. SbA6]|nr:hypothetical protein SBA6_620004 [Candidatus Sulfopaludibacter sp. SbA6]
MVEGLPHDGGLLQAETVNIFRTGARVVHFTSRAFPVNLAAGTISAAQSVRLPFGVGIEVEQA